MASAVRPGPFARKPTEHLTREASGEDGLAVQEIIEAAITSWTEGRVVEL